MLTEAMDAASVVLTEWGTNLGGIYSYFTKDDFFLSVSL